jgi:hypothetical protein
MEGGNNTNTAGQPGSPTLYWKGVNKGSEMAVGKGYITKSNAGTTIQFSGTPNNGDITTTFDLTRDDNKGKGFNLVGNPYPSYIDWTLVAAANPNLDNTYYYRTKNTNITNTYTFVTWNGAGSGNYVVSNGSLPVNTAITSHIPPTQAFWVRVKTGITKMYFNNGMREHRLDNNNLMKAPKVNTQQIIRLQVNNGTATDEVLIYFDAAASNAYDAFDSPKFAEANTVTQIYTSIGAEKLVINGMSTMPLDTPIGLGFVPGSATTFSIKANEISNLSTGVKVILKDNVTLAETDLTDGVSSYQFSPETTSTDRFSIIFRSSGVSTAIGKDNFDNLPLNVYKNRNNQIVIQRAVSQNATVTVCNAIGQKLFSSQMTGSSMVIDKAFDAGVYFVTLSITGIKTTQKIIIN